MALYVVTVSAWLCMCENSRPAGEGGSRLNRSKRGIPHLYAVNVALCVLRGAEGLVREDY